MRHPSRLADFLVPGCGALGLLVTGCQRSPCAEGASEVGGICLTDPELPEPPLEPGRFSSPLVELQRIVGPDGAIGTDGAGQDLLHLTEVVHRASTGGAPDMLVYCGYSFGAIDVSNPGGAQYLAQGFTHAPMTGHRKPGCLHLALDETESDIVYTSHFGGVEDGAPFLSGWDLESDSQGRPGLAPVQLQSLSEPGTAYEGLDYENGYVFVALHGAGIGVYRREDQVISRAATWPDVYENTFDVMVVGTTALVADGAAGLVVLDATDPLDPIELGRAELGGVARDLAVDGSFVYVATQGGGVAVVDLDEPSDPFVTATIATPGSATSVAVSDGHLAIAAWSDTRVYDVADPSAPRFVGAVRNTVSVDFEGDGGDRPDATAQTLAVELHEEILYVGNWFVPYTYKLQADRLAPYLILPESSSYLGFQGEVGPEASASLTFDVQNGGTAPLTVYDAWIDDPSFSVTPSELRIEPGEAAPFTVTFDGADIEKSGILHLRSDDPSQPERTGYVVGNADTIEVGDPLPPITGTLLDGTSWSYTPSPNGPVVLLAYFATF